MVSQNLARIRERIAAAAKRANRSPLEIRLICVTKTATAEQLKDAISCGVTDIGENRLQDVLLKYEQLGEMAKKVRWHMIGHLQTNKVKDALRIFDLIHSLDSVRLAEEIERRASVLGKRTDCLVEVNTSADAERYGTRPEEVSAFVRKVSASPHINIIGLMTMAPIVKDKEEARPYFIELHKLKERIRAECIPNTDIRELSMGMSQDFEVAVEEGATMVRIGTAIFRNAS